jgi:hypothetical protein
VTTPPLGVAPEMFERFAELVADRVAGRLHAEPVRRRLVDAAAVADTLGVSRDCVYAHADELGGKHIGNGPRGRLRFDLDQALAAWTSRSTSKESQQPKTPTTKGNPLRRRQQGMGSGAELLPIGGSSVPPNIGRGQS